ncbi:MAG: 5'/3'-nucleotidase SurE [Firmicutes bacterium]|jgi:5'-nucleotidase|nr:5'/3'-nucleotidase SurE [Bacillota bacterium]
MNILIANDDGINAEGIRRLAEALSERADVYIAAPRTQMSAAAHSITMRKTITVEETTFENAEAAYMIGGTPADCVKIGMRLYKENGIDIDMVYSGINHGSNLGTDTLYSGTVSAAIEGNLCGVPACAVSVSSSEAVHFDLACDLALRTLAKFPSLDNLTTVNINTPNEPKENIKGVKVCRLGIREYDNWFETGKSEGGLPEFRYSGAPVIYESKNTDIDVIAMQEGYATITPLFFDLTNHEKVWAMRRTWELDL